jgi:arylformamidase
LVSDGIDPLLEAEYSLRPRHPEREAVYAAMRKAGQSVRAANAATLDLRYGEGPRMRLDFFPATKAAPLFVFVHGGYWRALDKETFSFLAAPLLARGIAVAMPGYDLAPGTPLPQIEAQIDTCFAWLAMNAVALDFDPARVVVSGHSAGAQLTAMAALRGNHRLGLKGLLGISGVYDLAPLLRTSIGHAIGLTSTQAQGSSPARTLLRHPRLPGCFLVGALETDGFVRQTTSFAEAWRQAGGEADTLLVPDATHFTILERALDPARLASIEAWLSN